MQRLEILLETLRSARHRDQRDRRLRVLGVLAFGVVCCTTPAAAQTIKCSAFLNEGGGSWRSFFTGTVIGSRGPIAVKTGERLTRGDGGGKGEVAGLLDRLCASP